MRFLKALARGTSLALCIGLPAHAATHCSDTAESRWLYSCASALFEVRRAESPDQKDPGELNTDVLFKPQSSLPAELVDSCYELISQPDRVPSEALKSLSVSGWPLLYDPCTRSEHLQWLKSCEKDAFELLGHTRAELLVKFHEDAGFSAFAERAFIHRTCYYFKVQVHFLLQHDGAESPADVIDHVAPYVGLYVFG